MASLDDDDWNDVIIECSSLAGKWEQLSGYLGLSMRLIDVIKGNHPSNGIACWNEALKQWIIQNFKTAKYGYPSWKTLLGAIAIVDKLLFNKLAKEHQGIIAYLGVISNKKCLLARMSAACNSLPIVRVKINFGVLHS